MPERSREAYTFGDVALDVVERRLLRAGAPVTLPPKAFDVLVALVRRGGTLVSKRELLEVVWPDVHVEEGILAVHVASLRRALGRREWIETVPRSGYRFTPVAAAIARPRREGVSLRWPVGTLPAHPQVSELIGRGRQHLLTTSRSEIPKAIDAFRAAIVLDPNYAAAHAGLALACCAQAELRLAAPGDAYAEGRAAALRALAMEDASADAQVALATVLFLSDWNWTGARRSVERALDLDPDNTEGWLLYGRVLEALGDLEAGLGAKQKALERNPSSAVVHLQIALSYWNQRRYPEVIEWAQRALALDPSHLLAREFIAGAHLETGDLARHMEESIRHARCYGVPEPVLAELDALYRSGGRRAVIEHALASAGDLAPAVQHAVLNAELGRLDEAFHWLDAAIEKRDPSLVHIAVAPQWDPLRHDPRFNERLRRMGL